MRPSVEILSCAWLLTIGIPSMDCRSFQTAASSPAEPGGLQLTLGRAHGGEEARHFDSQLAAFARKRLRGGQDLARSRAGFAGSLGDVADVARDLRRALRGELHAAG